MNHQPFIDAINADPKDRTTQLVYADWLDDQGDPRGEAWRVMVEQGNRPDYTRYDKVWIWWMTGEPRYLGWEYLRHLLDATAPWPTCPFSYRTFFAAMDAGATAWVRRHREPWFLIHDLLSAEEGLHHAPEGVI